MRSKPVEPAIRIAAASDADTVAAISATAYERAYRAVIDGSLPAPATEDYRGRIARREVWLLDLGGRPVAVLVLQPGQGHLAIYSIAVDPRHQGRGHARRLLAFAVDQAISAGLPELRLFTNARMGANLALYRSCGFVETRTEPHPSRPGHRLVHLARSV